MTPGRQFVNHSEGLSMRLHPLVRRFARVLTRLERSDTDLKRRNARKVWKKLVDEVNELYPMLINGREIVRKGPPPCPFCKAIMKTWPSLDTTLNHNNAQK